MPSADRPRSRLLALGLELPAVSPPKGVYIPVLRSGRHVQVAGQVPMENGELVAAGSVGAGVSPQYARELSGRCALAALAAVDSVVGLDSVAQVVKVTGFVASAPGFTDLSAVVDGASALLVPVFGEAGRHARSVFGVPVLPLGSPVEIEVLVALAD